MELTCVRELQSKIELLEEKLGLLKAASDVPINKLDGLPHSKNLSSRVELVTQKKVDCERELERLRAELYVTMQELTIEIVEKVGGVAAQILVRRYVFLQPFKLIAEEVFLSEARVYQWHQSAVAKFGQG